MKVSYLGAHNAESKNTRMITILIDNVLAIDTGCLTSELSFSEQKQIKAILLTHGHYDHIIGVPAFAFSNPERTTKVYGPKQTIDFLTSHLLDGVIYPRFTEKIPFYLEKPSLELVEIEPFNPIDIEGYQVLALPVNHTIRTVGYEITSKNGAKVFYTGDTGQGLSALWEHITPHLLIIDVTFPNSLEIRAKNSSHLCPKMLRKELLEFREIKNYLPVITLVHLSPRYEREIKREINEIAQELDHPINIAREGETVSVKGGRYGREQIHSAL